MGWEPFDKKGSWQPPPSDQVFSIHFVDELTTHENPKTTLFLGYESKEKKQEERYLEIHWRKTWGKVILHLPLQLLKKRKYPCKQILDENLDSNMEERNEPMEVIHKPMKIIRRDTHTACHVASILQRHIYNVDQTFKQSLEQSVGRVTSEEIYKRAFTWSIPQV